MYNVINKALAACLLAASLTACTDKEREGATELYTQAEQQIEASNYSGALVLLDTLNNRYPAQTDIRRNGLRLRAMAMEGIAKDSLSAGSGRLAEATLEVDRLRPKFRHVASNVGLDGYFIPTGAPEKVMTSTGIQPRVSEKGFFYVVVNVQGKSIGFSSLEFVDGAESVSSSAISPSRVVRVEGSESASLNPEDLETAGPWLAAHPGVSKVILHGSKGSTTVKIDSKLASQLVECYLYAAALQAQRLASVKQEKYERMLATSRDQIANMPVAEQEK